VHVPITVAELEGLVALAGHGKTIPLTATTDTRVDSGFALNADAVDADWALASLANMRLDVGLRLAKALDEQPPTPVNEPGDRGLTDQEADRLRTIISGALGQRLDTEAERIGAITSAVRAWLETLT
jgi:hypothetical protein